jgi:hypothetical protein
MSLKRLRDGSWQLFCGCRSVFTSETLAGVTNSHADHRIGEHHLEVYGVDK